MSQKNSLVLKKMSHFSKIGGEQNVENLHFKKLLIFDKAGLTFFWDKSHHQQERLTLC